MFLNDKNDTYQFKYGWIESDSIVINDSRINILLYRRFFEEYYRFTIPRMESERKREIEKTYSKIIIISCVFFDQENTILKIHLHI